MIPITLNSTHVMALLDTGSSRSFVSNCFCNQLQKDSPKLLKAFIEKDCMLADASRITVSSAITVKVRFQDFTWKHEFWVMPDLAVSVVLGTDFMIATNMNLDFDQSHLYFKFNPDRVFVIQNQERAQLNLIASVDQGDTPHMQQLTSAQRQTLNNLINDFPDVLTKQLGSTDRGVCHLELTDKTPCRAHPYPLPPPKLQKLRQHIEHLLETGVITQTISDYSSPCFLVPKKDGSQRLVVDYRKLNAKIKFDTFPLPTIESALMQFGGAKYFTILDLNSAYHQIPLTLESQRYSAFITPFGSYTYTRLPFGLTVGSQILSRILANVFSDVSWQFLFLYLDDLLIFSNSFQEHMQHIKFVLNRLREAKFTVNPEKASFCASEISYLGYLISQSGIRVNPARIQPILDYPIPKNIRQVRRFVGMCGFYAKFIPHMSDIIDPLNSLKRKASKFKWEASQQQAFDTLKHCLSNPPLLHSPDFNQQFILQTDASDKALGAVLQQRRSNKLVPIAYASRLLTASEIHTSTYAKEALAAVWACERFSKYIEHSHFILQTDNQALSWLKAQPHCLGKIGRWLYRLSAFSFDVMHIPAVDNLVADSLSRLFEEAPVPIAATILSDYPLSFTSIELHQKEDEECANMIEQLKQGIKLPRFCLQRNLLTFQASLKTRKRVVIPKALQPMILQYFHSSILGGHLGTTKTLHKIAQHFFWPKMNHTVAEYVRSCSDCLLAKPAQHTHLGLHAASPSTRPWECVHIDFVGPLIKSTNGNIGILSIIDTFSKFVILLPVKRITAEITVSYLVDRVFSLFGPPQTLVSDNHSIFLSKAFKDLCFSWGIRHSRTSPYRPQGSHVERFHRNLRSSLIIFAHQNQTSWDYYIPFIQSAFNGAWHVSTKKTPCSLFLGRELLHPLLLAWNINLDDDAYLRPSDMEKRWGGRF